eukprot:TRINITY_DN17583_c0_g1_i1.p1 TRINITY_DN17583_c0_g1~~TRINITY_DN17583_c0_g1_i1.p1  ORF type:complete len:301 (-),score=4.37 TRINITY_DN17583_c0_g1_i1:72-902(-)
MRCVQVAKSVLGALQHMHNAGVVHRSVQPASVLIRPCGRYVLTGFHQAVRASEVKELARICCKASYCAPEVCAGREADCDSKMDIFACGLVLYFSISGIEPWCPHHSNLIQSETTTPRDDTHKFKLDFSGPSTKLVSRQFKELALMTTRWNPKKRPTAEVALACEWLGGIFSFSSGDQRANDGDARNVQASSRCKYHTYNSERSSDRPQTPSTSSGSAVNAILELRKDMGVDSASPSQPGSVFRDPVIPVAPSGRPASRFEGRRGGLFSSNFKSSP